MNYLGISRTKTLRPLGATWYVLVAEPDYTYVDECIQAQERLREHSHPKVPKPANVEDGGSIVLTQVQ